MYANMIRDDPYKFRWMFSSTIDLSFERRENKGEGGIQEGEEEKKRRKEWRAHEIERRSTGHASSRVRPFSSRRNRYPCQGPSPFCPPITIPLNGFKRPRRRQWGHVSGLANPSWPKNFWFITRPTLPSPLPSRKVEGRRKWRNLVLGTHGGEMYAWDFLRFKIPDMMGDVKDH